MIGITNKLRLLSFLGIHLILLGCNKSSSTATNAQAFDNAAQPIKDAWVNAVTADKNNDYVTAVINYRQILSQQTNLTEVQFTTARQAYGLLNQKLSTAAMNGDAAARQALNTLGPILHQGH